MSAALTAGRKIGWILALVLLALTGMLGVNNGIGEWQGAITPLQKSVTAGVLAYGILGLIGAAGLALRRRWSLPVVLAWGIVVTYVPAAAVLGYAPDGTWGAALPGSIAAGLIAAGVVWAAHVNTRATTTIGRET